MSKKFLTKDGLSWFFDKLKGNFAAIDSPHFKGSPTVVTPEYEANSKGKEVINREYLSKVKDVITDELEQKVTPIMIAFTISANDWEEDDPVYYCDIVKKRVQLDKMEEFKGISSSIKLDFLKSDLKLRKPILSFKLDIDKDLRIYLIGNKPNIDIPVIVTITKAVDLSFILGGI